MSTISNIQYKYYSGGYSGWQTPGSDDYQYCGADYGLAYKFSVSSIPTGYKITKIVLSASQLGSHDLRADLRTSEPTNNTFYNVGSSGTIATKTMSASTSVSITLSGFEITKAGTYYIFLKSTSAHTDAMLPKITLTATDTALSYTLSVSAGAGSSVTVKRGSTSLSNGATINYGDKLTITFSASTGYNLGTHTVNGTTFTSGNTHTVSGDVKVVSSASLKTYKLTISATSGGSVTVKRTSSSGGSTGNLSNGATLYYGDKLTVTYAPDGNHETTSATLNGSAINSGATHTVTAAVSVVVAFDIAAGLVYIYTGGQKPAFYVRIHHDGSWSLYSPYIRKGSTWTLYAG